jgi:hypothetical protein
MTGRHARPGRLARRQERRQTETSEYVAMLIRMHYAFGLRVSQDPAALGHLRDLETSFRDAVNLGIFAANRMGDRPYSMAEIGKVLGVSPQAVNKRVRLGEAVFVRLEAARAAGALVRLDDVRTSRAAVLGQAGVADTTGSPRELAAGSVGR